MTPRKRLSVALRRAPQAAADNQAAQNELHAAFFEAYGFDLDLEELGHGEAFVDGLVYGHGPTPSLSDFDKAVEELKAPTQMEKDNE